MEIAGQRERSGKTGSKQSGERSNYKKITKFIPPTHPAYIVTSNFTSPHITSLQDELDKNFIAMSMQTGKKKLAKIPDTPTDKYFIISDDSTGPVMLQGQFLTLNKKVINYPVSNNVDQVIEQFSSYIGLGKEEITEEKGGDSYQMENGKSFHELEQYRMKKQLENQQEMFKLESKGVNQRQFTGGHQVQYNGSSTIENVRNIFGQGNGQFSKEQFFETVVENGIENGVEYLGQKSIEKFTKDSNKKKIVNQDGRYQSITERRYQNQFERGKEKRGSEMSALSSRSQKKSKITLKKIVDRKEQQSELKAGKIYLFQSTKDSAEYIQAIQELKKKYGSSKQIVPTYSIDQCNYFCKNNKDHSNIVLMSQSSYERAGKLFKNYQSIAVFAEGDSKIDYTKQKNVSLYSCDFWSIIMYLQKYGIKAENDSNKNVEKNQLLAGSLEEKRFELQGANEQYALNMTGNDLSQGMMGNIKLEKEKEQQRLLLLEKSLIQQNEAIKLNNMINHQNQLHLLSKNGMNHNLLQNNQNISNRTEQILLAQGRPIQVAGRSKSSNINLKSALAGVSALKSLNENKKGNRVKIKSNIELKKIEDLDKQAFERIRLKSLKTMNQNDELLKIEEENSKIKSQKFNEQIQKAIQLKRSRSQEQILQLKRIQQTERILELQRVQEAQKALLLRKALELQKQKSLEIQRALQRQRINLDRSVSISPSAKKIKRLKSKSRLDSKSKIDSKDNSIEESFVSKSELDDGENYKERNRQKNISRIAHMRKGSDDYELSRGKSKEILKYSRRSSQLKGIGAFMALQASAQHNNHGALNCNCNCNCQHQNSINFNIKDEYKSSRNSGSDEKSKQVRFQPTIAKILENSQPNLSSNSKFTTHQEKSNQFFQVSGALPSPHTNALKRDVDVSRQTKMQIQMPSVSTIAAKQSQPKNESPQYSSKSMSGIKVKRNGKPSRTVVIPSKFPEKGLQGKVSLDIPLERLIEEDSPRQKSLVNELEDSSKLDLKSFIKENSFFVEENMIPLNKQSNLPEGSISKYNQCDKQDDDDKNEVVKVSSSNRIKDSDKNVQPSNLAAIREQSFEQTGGQSGKFEPFSLFKDEKQKPNEDKIIELSKDEKDPILLLQQSNLGEEEKKAMLKLFNQVKSNQKRFDLLKSMGLSVPQSCLIAKTKNHAKITQPNPMAQQPPEIAYFDSKPSLDDVENPHDMMIGRINVLSNDNRFDFSPEEEAKLAQIQFPFKNQEYPNGSNNSIPSSIHNNSYPYLTLKSPKGKGSKQSDPRFSFGSHRPSQEDIRATPVFNANLKGFPQKIPDGFKNHIEDEPSNFDFQVPTPLKQAFNLQPKCTEDRFAKSIKDIDSKYFPSNQLISANDIGSTKNTSGNGSNKILPLKSRKMTDNEKNNELVNKIFNMHKKPEIDNDRKMSIDDYSAPFEGDKEKDKSKKYLGFKEKKSDQYQFEGIPLGEQKRQNHKYVQKQNYGSRIVHSEQSLEESQKNFSSNQSSQNSCEKGSKNQMQFSNEFSSLTKNQDSSKYFSNSSSSEHKSECQANDLKVEEGMPLKKMYRKQKQFDKERDLSSKSIPKQKSKGNIKSHRSIEKQKSLSSKSIEKPFSKQKMNEKQYYPHGGSSKKSISKRREQKTKKYPPKSKNFSNKTSLQVSLQERKNQKDKNRGKFSPNQIQEKEQEHERSYQSLKEHSHISKEEDPYGLPKLRPLKKKAHLKNLGQKQFLSGENSSKKRLKLHRRSISSENFGNIGKIYLSNKKSRVKDFNSSDRNNSKSDSSKSKYSTDEYKNLPISPRFLPRHRIKSWRDKAPPENMHIQHEYSPLERNETQNHRSKYKISSFNPSSPLERQSYLNGIIDLSKYEKRIQNGITVYRAKEPIKFSYDPSLPVYSRQNSQKSKERSQSNSQQNSKQNFREPYSPYQQHYNRENQQHFPQEKQNQKNRQNFFGSPVSEIQFKQTVQNSRTNQSWRPVLNSMGLSDPPNAHFSSTSHNSQRKHQSYPYHNLYDKVKEEKWDDPSKPQQYTHKLPTNTMSQQQYQNSNSEQPHIIFKNQHLHPPCQSTAYNKNPSSYPRQKQNNQNFNSQREYFPFPRKSDPKEYEREVIQVNKLAKKVYHNILQVEEQLKNMPRRHVKPPFTQVQVNTMKEHEHPFDSNHPRRAQYENRENNVEKQRKTLHQLSNNGSADFVKMQKPPSSLQQNKDGQKYLTAMKYLQLIESWQDKKPNEGHKPYQQIQSQQKKSQKQCEKLKKKQCLHKMPPTCTKNNHKLKKTDNMPKVPPNFNDKNLPKISEKRIQEIESDNQKSVDSKYETIVLYLVDKRKEKDFPEINLIKNEKDSLLYYKSLKHLALQLQKSIHIYDIIYVIVYQDELQVKSIIKKYSNCYILEFSSEKSKVHHQSVIIPDFSQLQEVTHSLVQQNTQRRKTKSLMRSKSQQICLKKNQHLCKAIYDPSVCTYNCCFPKPTAHHCSCVPIVPKTCQHCNGTHQ